MQNPDLESITMVSDTHVGWWQNGADVEGDELSLSLNSPASDFADFEIYGIR